MPNTLLTPSLITKEFLMRFKNNLGFASVVKQEQRDWWNEGGAKKGDSITIRRAVKFEAVDGEVYVGQDVEETGIPLTLNKRKHVGFEFPTKDLTLTIERFGERYLESASVALANKFEVDGLTVAYQACPNFVGTPGNGGPTDSEVYLEAMQRIFDNGAPQDDRFYTTINPKMQRKIVNAEKTLFNSQSDLAKMYRRGMMGVAHGSTWGMSQNIRTHIVGSLAGSGLTNGVPANGATTVVTDDWTALTNGVIKKGDIVRFDAVYAVNPVSGDVLSDLKDFVATADCASDAGGNITIPIYPAIITSGPYKTCSASPADGVGVQVFGHVSTYAGLSTPQGLTYHKEAFCFGMAKLMKPDGVDFAASEVDPETGLSVRIVRDYDFNNDLIKTRCDILYGWAAPQPEWACRIAG